MENMNMKNVTFVDNEMLELSLDEVALINGGMPPPPQFWPFVTGAIVGGMLYDGVKAMIGGYINHMEREVQNGWGSNPGTPPPNSGFGTI
ncbi:hypothetical protein GCM10009092_22990 [Bowmanella denitrificans]|uniref:Class IIb bacteriocin, lactobin A/cerein 7B family n=1 Tax=Bowmanella denitrificans TaxID=366582 RepID=A0ABN0X8W2_9ALTE